jgi:4-phytase/acid phosphatase
LKEIRMTRCADLRLFLFGLLILVATGGPLGAQSDAIGSGAEQADLQLVVMLSRHGVRSPLDTPGMYDKYAVAPWPKWEVAPGILTPRGYELMKIFGTWDRLKFAGQGLLTSTGCGDAPHVTILADSDQRTRETGKALAEGMLPGCGVLVQAQAEGTNDPLFRAANAGRVAPGTEAAAIAGRIGGDPKNLTEGYRPQLAVLDQVLAGCGRQPANPKRTSIFDVAASRTSSPSYIPAAFRGPVALGATMAENLLLEYTQGMSDADTGWGCLDGETLRTVMQLDTANWEYGSRTRVIARANAANLLDHIEKSMEQSVTGKPVAGALGKPGDRLILLVGHDSNIVAIAGALGINWILDGRVDDTPPGGALLFELWRSRVDGKPFVRLKYTAQTLEQMRKTEMLSPANPPGEAPIFVPGCGRADMSCTWEGFSAAMRQAIDPAYTAAQP